MPTVKQRCKIGPSVTSPFPFFCGAGEFEKMQVFFNEPKYPNLRVSYLYSSIFLAPRCYCDSNLYLVDDDPAGKTVAAHKYMNGYEPDLGCPKEDKKNKFRKGIR